MRSRAGARERACASACALPLWPAAALPPLACAPQVAAAAAAGPRARAVRGAAARARLLGALRAGPGPRAPGGALGRGRALACGCSARPRAGGAAGRAAAAAGHLQVRCWLEGMAAHAAAPGAGGCCMLCPPALRRTPPCTHPPPPHCRLLSRMLHGHAPPTGALPDTGPAAASAAGVLEVPAASLPPAQPGSARLQPPACAMPSTLRLLPSYQHLMQCSRR